MNLPYELTSAGMAVITLIFFSYKKWLDLRKNRLFRDILVFGSAFLVLDGLLGIFCSLSLIQQTEYTMLSEIAQGVFGAIIFYLYLLYDLAIVRKMRVQYSIYLRLLVIMMLTVAFIKTAVVIYEFMGYGGTYFYLLKSIIYFFQHGFIFLCMFIGIWYLIRYRSTISKRETAILLSCHIATVAVEFMMQLRGWSSGVISYTLAFTAVVYYMLLHNNDQYRYRFSGCFVRDGFNLVVQEKAIYKENFVCLGICINNTESITNYCTAEEIRTLQHSLGKYLNRECRWVYHLHSFEYVIMTKNVAAAERYFQVLREELPDYIRINDKNVTLVCGYYILEFADASFVSRDFNRIHTSLKKIALEQRDSSVPVRYQGEQQQEIQHALDTMCEINKIIADKNYKLKILPIQSTDDEGTLSLELLPDEYLLDGIPISQEKIWEIVQEVGYSPELTYQYFDYCCKYVKEKKLFDENIERIHMNLAPFKLTGMEAAKRFVDILEKNEIPFDKMCFEITIDQNVQYDRLREGMMYLKKFGISLLFDQFGVSVCNLKQALNLPFDAVKINHHFVGKYCAGSSKQLKYMIDMLFRNGWRIYVDGVDNEMFLSILCEMEIDYIQGRLVSALLQKDDSDILFAQLGDKK